MASTTTTEPDLVLQAPAPVKVLAPEKAAGEDLAEEAGDHLEAVCISCHQYTHQ